MGSSAIRKEGLSFEKRGETRRNGRGTLTVPARKKIASQIRKLSRKEGEVSTSEKKKKRELSIAGD